MTEASSDRRLSVRENSKIPIRVRIWKSANQEELGESENLSKRGILFATDSVIAVGTTLEIFLKMPEMIKRGVDERMALLRPSSASGT